MLQPSRFFREFRRRSSDQSRVASETAGVKEVAGARARTVMWTWSSGRGLLRSANWRLHVIGANHEDDISARALRIDVLRIARGDLRQRHRRRLEARQA